MIKDFLHVNDLSKDQFYNMMDLSGWIKSNIHDKNYMPMSNKSMAMIFAKPSARTRVSLKLVFLN